MNWNHEQTRKRQIIGKFSRIKLLFDLSTEHKGYAFQSFSALFGSSLNKFLLWITFPKTNSKNRLY